jgi:hypothetical protein
MNTIASHLTVATVLAAGHLGLVRFPDAARAVAQPAGGIATVVVMLVVVIVAALARAARGMAVLMSQFLQLAAAMMSVFLTMVIAVIAAAILLAHL